MADRASRSILLPALPVLGIAVAGILLASMTRNRAANKSDPNFQTAILHSYIRTGDYTLPPGPKGKPIIKNLLDLPTNEQWLRVTEWAKEFGTHILLLP